VGVALWSAFYGLVATVGGAAGFDSHAYWLTRRGVDYSLDPSKRDAYLYSPAFAHAIRPLAELPWPIFGLLWSGAALATYLWITHGATPLARAGLLALCLGDLVYGNVWWLFAIVVVYGFRRPALWAIPLLLKITPAVGLIWFAVRREWRNLFVAVAAASVVVAFSVCLDAHAWAEWISFLHGKHHPQAVDRPVPQAIRLLIGLSLAAHAARTDRKQLLPIALWLATPVFSINGIAIFATIPLLARLEEQAAERVARRTPASEPPRARQVLVD
jgi:hypothetical protein